MITFPLEFIKVCACMYTGSIINRIEQSYHTSAHSHRRAIVILVQVQLQLQHLYKQSEFGGPVECALYTVRHKGATGLYKGLTPWLVFALPRYILIR